MIKRCKKVDPCVDWVGKRFKYRGRPEYGIMTIYDTYQDEDGSYMIRHKGGNNGKGVNAGYDKDGLNEVGTEWDLIFLD